MNESKRRCSVGCGMMAAFWLLPAVGLLILLAGCSDHRMSMAEFMALQEQRQEEAAQVETDRKVVTQRLDRKLGPYRVGAADVLAVVVTGVDQEVPFPPLQVRIDREGNIDLPVVGAVAVASKELEDVEAAIHAAYVPRVLKDATVHVQVAELATTNVLVVGAVTRPGLVPLRRTERDVFHAIVNAGGLVSELASGSATLCRIRQPEDKVTLDLTQPEGIQVALALDPLEHGDILTVHAATPNTYFVGGLVNAPHPQQYPQGVRMTVLQVLAASLGLRTDISPREATLIRRMADGSDVHVKLDLDRITTGKDPNLVLAAGDILWVPHTFSTRVQDWVNRNVFVRAGVSATAGVNYNAYGTEYLNSNAERSATNYYQQNLQDSFDPLGFLTRNYALQNLTTQAAQP